MPESLHVSVCTSMDDYCVHSSITKHISRLHACKIERVFDKICVHSSMARSALRFSVHGNVHVSVISSVH